MIGNVSKNNPLVFSQNSEMSIDADKKAIVTNTSDDLLSETISFVRFPMAFLVAVIHGYFVKVIIDGGKTVIDFSSYNVFSNVVYVTGEITSVAVPVFYILSGFLFFYKVQDYTREIYFAKLRKRMNSLLVPYIIWNMFSALFFMFGQHLMPSIFSGTSANVSDYTFKEWLLIFWNDSGTGYPASSQLWFLRDLMIVVIASPLVYMYIKFSRLFGIIVLWLLWFLDIEPDVIGLNATSFFLFSLGAYFSLNRVNFVMLSEYLLKKGLFVMYIIVLIVALLFQDTTYSPYLHKLCISIGVFVVFGIAYSYLKGGGHSNMFLSKSTMFIYLSHLLPILFFKKFLISIIRPENELTALLVYFLCPVVIVTSCLFLFSILRKYVPIFTSVITGGRV